MFGFVFCLFFVKAFLLVMVGIFLFFPVFQKNLIV